MARLTTSLFLVWALLLGPALCAGGLLEHACDCGSEIQCQHEESCADDPCPSIVRPQDLHSRATLELQAAMLAEPSCRESEVDSARRSWFSPPPPPPDGSNLPYADSDRPLRI